MNLFINEDGELKYDSGLVFIGITKTFTIPIETINSITTYCNLKYDSKVQIVLSERNISLFLFDKQFRSYAIVNNEVSGNTLVNQAMKYVNDRLVIAKEFVISSIFNMICVLRYYGIDLNNTIFESRQIVKKNIGSCIDYNHLLAKEAEYRKKYYAYFNEIINNNDFAFINRSTRPPKDSINSLISFGNSLLYKECLEAIVQSKICKCISFLHSSNERINGLEYDISEIYKPLIVDRTIFTCINKKIITNEDFIENDYGVIIKWDARNKFINQFYKKLSSTIVMKNKRISYKGLIVKDCIKLRNFINRKSEYLSFFKGRW